MQQIAQETGVPVPSRSCPSDSTEFPMPPKLIVRMHRIFQGIYDHRQVFHSYCWPPPMRAACLTALPTHRICPTWSSRATESRLIAALLPQRLPSDVPSPASIALTVVCGIITMGCGWGTPSFQDRAGLFMAFWSGPCLLPVAGRRLCAMRSFWSVLHGG